MRMPRPLPNALWLGLLLLPVPARAQGPASSVPAQPAPAPAQAPSDAPALPAAGGDESVSMPGARPYVDLSHRYRFSEQYSARDASTAPGVVGAYRVTARETFREGEAGAAPGLPARVRHFEYSERPAEVSGLGTVTATIRSYEKFQSLPEETTADSPSPLLVGLTVWYRPQRDALPQVLSLEGRRLREREYDLAAHQIFLPGLAAILPNAAVRIGDTWRVPPKAVQALLGEPETRAVMFTGKFVGLRRPPVGPTLQAILAVTGKIQTPLAETLVNAEVAFTFAVPRPGDDAKKAGAPGGDDSLIDVRGAVTDLRLARVAQGTVPAAPGGQPQKFRAEQQVVLMRKLGGLGPVVRGIAPTTTPPATVANSWLTYTDPKGRFSFQHPQDLLPPNRGQTSPGGNSNTIFLTKGGPDGRDLVQIEVFGERREPQALKDSLNVTWKRYQAEVIPGGEEWLPSLDWPSSKVYRIEAALKPPLRGPRAPRIHFDAYLLQLADDSSMTVIATTTRDAVPSYRRDIEQMLKTIRLSSGG